MHRRLSVNGTLYNVFDMRGRRGRDGMVVGFRNTFAISVYHY